MKRFISIALTLIMCVSAFGGLTAFADNVNATVSVDASSVSAVALSGYTENFNANYFFMPTFTTEEKLNGEKLVVATIACETEETINLELAQYLDSGNAWCGLNGRNTITKCEISAETTSVDKDCVQDVSFFSNNAVTLGVILTNGTSLKKDAKVTITLNGYPLDPEEGVADKTAEPICYGVAEYTFEAPVSFSTENAEALAGFAKVLTDIKFENTIEPEDVANAVKTLALAENRVAAVEELKDIIADNDIATLANILDVNTITYETNNETAYSVELPWAAMADGAEGNVVFATNVKEGTKVSDEELAENEVNDQIALDIELAMNGVKLEAPIVKQKVVVELPSGWTGDVKYKHEDGAWDKAEVEGHTAVFYTDSFSNFVIAGTKAVADDDKRTSAVSIVIEQLKDDNGDGKNVFDIYIKPESGKQIINYAVGGYAVDIFNDGIDAAEQMKTLSYDLKAAPGINITTPVDDATSSNLASFEFNTTIPDEMPLITAGVDENVKIATLTINGVGKFKMSVGGADKEYVTDDTKNYIMMKTSEAGYDDDKYASIISNNANEIWEIKEKTYKLNFVVDYPYSIESKDADYLDMTITIKNTVTGEIKTVMVGTKGTKEADAYLDVTINNEGSLDNSAKAEGYIELPERATYEFEIAAGGFRKFRDSVYLDMDKTINLWNSVYTTAQPVVKGDDRAANQKTITFLVGDIWMDNKVDVYDLSAVTSYFGTKNIEAGSDYVQYDLDRNGEVNLRDIGYVQLTYGN